MTTEIKNFLLENGIPLHNTYEGNNEYALNYDDSLSFLKLMKSASIPIIGGDILTTNKYNSLIYAYQDWGSKYHTLNWSYDRNDNESNKDYLNNSIDFAKCKIKEAKIISEKLNKVLLIVFIY